MEEVLKVSYARKNGSEVTGKVTGARRPLQLRVRLKLHLCMWRDKESEDKQTPGSDTVNI